MHTRFDRAGRSRSEKVMKVSYAFTSTDGLASAILTLSFRFSKVLLVRFLVFKRNSLTTCRALLILVRSSTILAPYRYIACGLSQQTCSPSLLLVYQAKLPEQRGRITS